VAQRKGRVTAAQVGEFLDDLAELPIQVAPAIGAEQWAAILTVAEHHGLTAYDAAYLHLAQRAGLPLATLDRDLRKAVTAAGATLVEA